MELQGVVQDEETDVLMGVREVPDEYSCNIMGDTCRWDKLFWEQHNSWTWTHLEPNNEYAHIYWHAWKNHVWGVYCLHRWLKDCKRNPNCNKNIKSKKSWGFEQHSFQSHFSLCYQLEEDEAVRNSVWMLWWNWLLIIFRILVQMIFQCDCCTIICSRRHRPIVFCIVQL